MKIQFDSQPEEWFYHWLVEAVEYGFVRNFEYHPEPFILSEVVKIEEWVQLKTKKKKKYRHLLAGHVYQPDFRIAVRPFFNIIEHKLFINDRSAIYIDVKGGYANPKYHSNRGFPINQKWVYQKYGIFVNKVVCETFFKRTWVPKAIIKGVKVKRYKKWKDYLTYDERRKDWFRGEDR